LLWTWFRTPLSENFEAAPKVAALTALGSCHGDWDRQRHGSFCGSDDHGADDCDEGALKQHPFEHQKGFRFGNHFPFFLALWYIEVCYDILDMHIQYIH
jgi:hypothetical protein